MKYRMFWVTTVLLMMFGWNWMLEGGDAWRGWSQEPWVDGDGMEIAIRSSAEDQLAVVGTTGDSLTAAEKPTEKPMPAAAVRWFKGNLHTHSLWSDGNDFPEMIADWYREQGYQFLALSDHNILSEGQKWMSLKTIEARNGKTALGKYLSRMGSEWVETRGSREKENLEIRLKTLAEIRKKVEQTGQFLMFPSEEITDKGVHINATNIGRLIRPQGGANVQETIRNNLRAVAAQAKELNRTILPHLNHPNLGNSGISAENLAALVEDRFVEIHNGVEGDGDLGSAQRHGLESLWDIASTLRISRFDAPPLFGLATDDSHHYHGGRKASPGRGWICVRASELNTQSILDAIQEGQFYASTGIELVSVEFDPEKQLLEIEIKPQGDAVFTTSFLGTMVDFDDSSSPRIDRKTGKEIPTTRDYSEDIGKVFSTVEGLKASYRLTGKELYVRAMIQSNQKPENPTSESVFRQAWTQPVGWKKHLTEKKSP